MSEPITDLFGSPDEEAMYQAALAVDPIEKEKMAIMLLQTFEKQALSFSEEGYYVCFSGGKDSIVIADLCKKAKVKHTLNYANVTLDPPSLLENMRRYYPDVRWHNHPSGLSLLNFMATKGKPMPTRLIRWCCQEFKHIGPKDGYKVVGVRAVESPRRKGLWQQVKKDTASNSVFVSPILYWTDDDVWEYIHFNKLPYPHLYNQGYKRLGCIGCPLGANRRKEFDENPKYEAMYKRAFKRLWENYHDKINSKGKPYFASRWDSWESMWSWWMKEDNVNDTDQPDCQLYLW